MFMQDDLEQSSEQSDDYGAILSSIRDMLESDDKAKVRSAPLSSGGSRVVFNLLPDYLVVLGNKVKLRDKLLLQGNLSTSLDTIFKEWLISHKKEVISVINGNKNGSKAVD